MLAALDFLGTHSVTILICMALVFGLGLAIDHAMAQFELEEAETHAQGRE